MLKHSVDEIYGAENIALTFNLFSSLRFVS